MFHSVEELACAVHGSGLDVWQVILQDDCDEQGLSAEESIGKMASLWEAMKDSAADSEGGHSARLVGGEGRKMEAYRTGHQPLSGDFMARVISRALTVGCANACMRRIVAAPTAGSCGVLPAVLITCREEYGFSDTDILHALYVAAGFGQVIACRAFLAGAAGGCQAEIGAASAMAAAALVSLRDGTVDQMADACAMALKNLLGLVCDPVAGLVEVPCVKRNVTGAVNALAAADMALAGIRSVIPADQVIDAMKDVGEKMDASLRETARGGLAATPRGRELAEILRGDAHAEL